MTRLLNKGHYEGAKALLEVALDIFENRLGPSHPYTEIARNHLAALEPK